MKTSLFIIGIIFSLTACNSKPGAVSSNTSEAQSVAEGKGKQFSLVNNESGLQWKGWKPTGEHVGEVSISKGNINVDNGNIVSGAFVIDLNTITNHDLTNEGMNKKLVDHLKSPDFFEVEKHPEAMFEIVSVSEIKEASSAAEELIPTHEVTGNLTIRGITKSISFPAKVDIGQSEITAVTAPFILDRTQWGVNYNSKSVFAELKDKFISDEMIISLNLSFIEM